jgi:Bacterial PH domain
VRAEWAPAAGLVALAWIITAAAAAWSTLTWVTAADPAGGLIATVATLGAGSAALFGTLARPRLRADADGVTVGGLLGQRHHPWPLVQGVRVLRVRRLGRESSLLELDTITAHGDERLYLFGRLDLAADPEDVAPQLTSVRP